MIRCFLKKIQKKDMFFWFIYIVIFAWSINNDLHFFDFAYINSESYYEASGNPHAKLFYMTIKIAFAVLLYYFMNMVMRELSAVRKKDRDSRRRLIFVLVILTIYLVLLILCWPGIWWCSGADEFKMVDFIAHLQVQYHQGFMMSLFYFLAFMVYPNPASVVILQMLLGSILFGTIMADWWKNRHYISVTVIACVIFSPCGLYFALYPMRAYLTAVFLVYYIYLYRKNYVKEIVYKDDWIKMITVLSIVINFRTEMLLLIMLFPILMWKKECLKNKKYLCQTGLGIVFLCLSVLVVSCWNRLGNQACSVGHNLLSFVAPVGEILADHYDQIDKADIEILDKFFDVQTMRDEHKLSENKLKYYSYERVTSPSTAYDISEYHRAQLVIFKLCLKYPDVYLKNKISLAKKTFGLWETGENKYHFPDEIKPERIAYLFRQLCPELADKIKGRIAGNFEIAGNAAFPVLYAMWVPVILLIVDLLISIFRGKNTFTALKISLLAIYLVVFMTAIHPYTMYYFAPYAGAWFVLFPLSKDKHSFESTIA